MTGEPKMLIAQSEEFIRVQVIQSIILKCTVNPERYRCLNLRGNHHGILTSPTSVQPGKKDNIQI